MIQIQWKNGNFMLLQERWMNQFDDFFNLMFDPVTSSSDEKQFQSDMTIFFGIAILSIDDPCYPSLQKQEQVLRYN